jgi:hypothetical protein
MLRFIKCEFNLTLVGRFYVELINEITLKSNVLRFWVVLKSLVWLLMC